MIGSQTNSTGASSGGGAETVRLKLRNSDRTESAEFSNTRPIK